MSVLIHGMELDGRPHKALLTERDGKPVLVVETQYSYADNEIRVYPVEEIPPHGRLIDADKLRKAMYHEAFEIDSPMQRWDSGCWIRYKMFERAEENAPTIIPAEEVPGHE